MVFYPGIVTVELEQFWTRLQAAFSLETEDVRQPAGLDLLGALPDLPRLRLNSRLNSLTILRLGGDATLDAQAILAPF